jgi:hypothetical protein
MPKTTKTSKAPVAKGPNEPAEELVVPNFTASSKDWLTKAINHCKSSILDIGQFAKVINHPLCMKTFDMFYVSLMHGYPIYLSNDTIEWFGYIGNIGKQKEKIKNILEKYYVKDVDWFDYSPDVYAAIYKKINNPPLARGELNTTAQIEHKNEEICNQELTIFTDNIEPPMLPPPGGNSYRIIINADIFKKVVMRSKSPKAEQIREYYIDLEDIVFKYMEYVMNMRKSTGLGLIEQMNQLNITMKENEVSRNEERKKAEEERKKAEEERKKAEEERKKAEEERKKADARFEALMDRTANVQTTLDQTNNTLVDTNRKLDIAVVDRVIQPPPSRYNEYLIILKNEEPDDDERTYYCIRSQKYSATAQAKKIINDRDAAYEILRINSPNAKKLWQTFLNKYGRSVETYGQWFDLCAGRRENKLLERIQRTHDDRVQVD